MQEKPTSKKIFTLKEKLELIGCTLGLVACIGAGYAMNNQNKRDAEMEKFGYAHISPNRIEYANGYEAEAIFDKGKVKEIDVTTYLVPVDSLGSKAALGKNIYKPGDKDFSEIEQNILGMPKQLAK